MSCGTECLGLDLQSPRVSLSSTVVDVRHSTIACTCSTTAQMWIRIGNGRNAARQCDVKTVAVVRPLLSPSGRQKSSTLVRPRTHHKTKVVVLSARTIEDTSWGTRHPASALADEEAHGTVSWWRCWSSWVPDYSPTYIYSDVQIEDLGKCHWWRRSWHPGWRPASEPRRRWTPRRWRRDARARRVDHCVEDGDEERRGAVHCNIGLCGGRLSLPPYSRLVASVAVRAAPPLTTSRWAQTHSVGSLWLVSELRCSRSAELLFTFSVHLFHKSGKKHKLHHNLWI